MTMLGTWDSQRDAVLFSVSDGTTAARIAGDVLQLVSLDGVWTRAAQRNRPDEIADLGPVVEQMDAILARLTEDTKRVFELLQNLNEDHVEALLAHPQFATGDLVPKLRTRARRDGGVLAMIRKGLTRAGDNFSRDRAALGGELERLRKGRQSDGDLDSLTHCGLGLIEMGLGLGMAGGLPLFVDGAERVVENCAG